VSGALNSDAADGGPSQRSVSMEKPPKKTSQHRPQPEAQHHGQDPWLKGREANNLTGIDSLTLYLTGVDSLSL
jgi:hypothetical protein